MDDLLRRWTAAMRAGDWPGVWAISDAVLAARDPATRDDPALPYHRRWVWDGRPPGGRRVVVRCYHGLGDTLMFARFLAPLAARANGVTLEVQPALVPLLGGLPVDRLVPFDPARPVPPGELDMEIMELSHVLRLTPRAVSPACLRVAPASLPPGTVALCPGLDGWDPARRLPADLLGDICARYPCVSAVPEPADMRVINPDGCPADIRETAALLAAAALVVTVDTMVAHLAGALGRPMIVLLKSDPDWRWQDGRTSCWYPDARLYRQPAPGDWTAAVAAVMRDLPAHLDGNLVEREQAQPARA